MQDCVRSVRWWSCLQQTTPCVVRLHFCFYLQSNPEIGTLFLFMASVASFCSGQSSRSFFLQSNSMWKDILTIRGKNDTGSQCAQTCFLIYSRTLRASLLWSNSRRHPHTHPPASIHHKIPLEANILVIDFSSQVSADPRDE